ncbi:MAG: hypothetical protein EOO50_17250 [Flavobacterium sp.]|uniref:hypothetical protein n=1 Tax=Flavobacterium sp. TaxID=239 RepID=UPI00120378B8|nr:hypothetical protein [Flavobacterium sp.]RZJ63272.1 MAG: hypothetical protein EOO50_17250 [Flavobacterium sp.]
METTITLPRTEEQQLGQIVVMGKKMLGHCEMSSNNDNFTLHWTFKAPQYRDLFLRRISCEITHQN